MRIWALTGGIATGKSTVGGMLRDEMVGVRIFDCDACVRGLLAGDAGIARELKQAFGDGVLGARGEVDRAFLRGRVFDHPAERKRLEAILHPRVREECLDSLAAAAKEGAALFVADVPLLFEKGFDFGQQCSLLVAVSRSTQIERLRARDGFDRDMIESILAAQLPIEDKLAMADVVFWNEGPESLMRAQVRRFAQSLIMTDPESVPQPEAQNASVAPVAKAHEPPAAIDLNAFRRKPLAELQTMAEALPARIPAGLTRSQLIFELLGFYSREGAEITGEGVLEIGKEGFGMLRDAQRSFRVCADDLYLGNHQIRELGLRAGNLVKVRLRAPRERDKYLSVSEVIAVEGIPVANWQAPVDFDKLTPMFPDRRLVLEGEGPDFLGVRLIDLVAPLGKGQRGLIVAPPRGGKTMLLKQIARSLRLNHPEITLLIVLLDERPEEVTDFEESVGAEVYASTFDESPRRHAQVADMVIDRAKRLVEQGKDVVLLLDSLTRLARGQNAAMSGGPIGSGGVNPVALQKSRKFFGTARNVEEGGSLTILATALVETESRMDDVIFEEFKGTGNMEVRLDRELAERRIYPAIHIPQSGTRNDDRLYHPDEVLRVFDLRRQLAQLPVGEAVELLMQNLRATKTNAELLLRGIR